MGRLIKEALFSNELVDKHDLRMRQAIGAHPGSGETENVEDPETTWETLPDRIRRIDPHGERSYALLQEVESRP